MDLGVRQKKRTASPENMIVLTGNSSHCVAPVRINKENSSAGRRGGPAGPAYPARRRKVRITSTREDFHIRL